MSEKWYSTNCMVKGLEIHKGCGAAFTNDFVDAIIARLLKADKDKAKADKLCDAAKDEWVKTHNYKLGKAIADYEED